MIKKFYKEKMPDYYRFIEKFGKLIEKFDNNQVNLKNYQMHHIIPESIGGGWRNNIVSLVSKTGTASTIRIPVETMEFSVISEAAKD
jgi:hypothetical protein